MTTFRIRAKKVKEIFSGAHTYFFFSKQLKNREYQTSDVIQILVQTYLWEIADDLNFLSLSDETYVKLKSDCIFQFTYLQTYRK